MRLFTLCVISLCCLLANAVQAKTLRVGIAADYPPMAYYDGKQLSGIDVVAAEALAKQLNMDAKLVEKPRQVLVAALQAGEIDIIMSGLTVSDALKQQVAFTDSYMDAGQMAIIRFNDAGRFGFRGALFRPGVKVAVVENTAGEAYASARLQNASVIRCSNIADAFGKLQGGSVDFFIHDAPVSGYLASEKNHADLMSLNQPLTEDHMAWAVAKNNQPLLEAVNQQLAAMQQSGMMRAIIGKWLPVAVEASQP